MKDFGVPWRIRLDGVWLDEAQCEAFQIEYDTEDVTTIGEVISGAPRRREQTGLQRVRIGDGPWSDWRGPGDWLVTE